MKIDFPPPPSRRGPPSGAPRDGTEARSRSSGRLGLVLLSSALLALVLGCGGSRAEEAAEPLGCASDDECADGAQCVDAACVAPSPAPSMSAGTLACSVVSCPPSQPSCCTAAAATAAGNESQGYASRNEMVARASSSLEGGVIAAFSFDAAGQQGWLTFELDSELDLDRLEFTGHHLNADPFLTVNTNLSSDSGCAFGFDLDLRPPPMGDGPLALGANISFDNDDDEFCYGGARPGQARQLAFAIFSMQPGVATLFISNITLHE